MTISHQKPRLHWLQALTHIGAWIPLAVLIFDFFNNRLSFNPIQAATQRTGHIAIVLLILSLACTPVKTLFHFTPVIRVRRSLGLYAYFYAALHLLIFTGADYGFDLGLIGQTIIEKRFILAGMASFLLLSLLALTSFRWWMARLGKNWKQLHRVVYLINLLVVLHYAWAVKGDLFRLQGNILGPLAAGIIVLLLLAARLPGVRKRAVNLFPPKTHTDRLDSASGGRSAVKIGKPGSTDP
jgi:sulfoxide reductase heme-binding subunit YedZ